MIMRISFLRLQSNNALSKWDVHHTSYVNIPSGDCGDKRASTLLINLQGIITWPTNLPLGFSFGPERNSSVLSRRMFSSLSVPTKVPKKIRPSVTVTRSVSFKRLRTAESEDSIG